MPTDPARVRLSDPGDPDKCPVWQLHRIYSSEDTKKWVREGCTTAAFGCLECKKPLIQKVLEEQQQIQERARPYEQNPAMVREVIEHGNRRAREVAKSTMEIVRDAVGTTYT
jgi:tryptophanyl-tRNA synthetase